MPDQPKPQTAREGFEEFLARYQQVRLLFVNHPALECPADVRPDNTPQSFAYGLDMAKPIPDLEVTDEGVRATLSFSNTPCPTFVPWACVLGFRGINERAKQRPTLKAV
jgi:hypothetical protein